MKKLGAILYQRLAEIKKGQSPEDVDNEQQEMERRLNIANSELKNLSIPKDKINDERNRILRTMES